MKRKFLLFLTAMLLSLSVNTVCAAAAETQSVTLSLEGKTAEGGVSQSFVHHDLLYVTVNADGALSNHGMGITVYYDGDILTPVLKESTSAEPLEIHGPITVGGKTALRISCYPGTSTALSGDQPLATLAFQADKPAAETELKIAKAYQYQPAAEAVPDEEPLSIAIVAIPVTEVRLDQTMLSMETKKTAQLTATVLPEKATDGTVTWTSSDETVLTVVDGRITAKSPGEATVTAEAGGCSAVCTVKVTEPPDAGYKVRIPENKYSVINGEIEYAPIIINQEADSFNAYTFTMTYDPDMLHLVAEEPTDDGMKIVVSEESEDLWKVQVLRYGGDIDLGESGAVPFTLRFKTLGVGRTEISLTEARVDHSENALIQNVSRALMDESDTVVTIGGYPITLPLGFSADELTLEAAHGEAFVFRATSPYYLYNFDDSTMGALKPVRYEKNKDGDVLIHFGETAGGNAQEVLEYVQPDAGRSYVIPYVTAPVEIRVTSQGKTFTVTRLGSAPLEAFEGEAQARYGEPYVLTQKLSGTFTTPVIDGIACGTLQPETNAEGKYVYTIPGDKITADFTVTINGTVNEGGDDDEPDTPPPSSEPSGDPDHGPVLELKGQGITVVSGGGDDFGERDLVFYLENPELYDYTLTVKVGGKTINPNQLYDEETDSYILEKAKITGDVEIIANRTGKAFKVTISGTGKADVDGSNEARYGTDYEFVLDEQSGYKYTFAITIGGESYEDYDLDGDTYTIHGKDITGAVIIKVTRTADSSDSGSSGSSSSGSSGSSSSSSSNQTSSTQKTTTTTKKTVTSTFAGSGAEDITGKKTATQNQDYSFQLKQQKGFRYEITVTAGGKDVPYTFDEATGTYTVAGKDVTGDLIVTVNKIPVVEVSEYITLDKRSIFLVSYPAATEKGQIPQYDGNNMYWSDAYNAYVWLVVSDQTDEWMQKEAGQKLLLAKGQQAGKVDYSGNVDLSKYTDMADARLVVDIYQGKHDLNSLEMQKLLCADVCPDKKVTVQDAAVIAAKVLAAEGGEHK